MTQNHYTKIKKITEESQGLEESDDFDDNRDVTATDVRKKVDAKCKGWDSLKEDTVLQSLTNKSSKRSSRK